MLTAITLVAVGGALGAVARFATVVLMQQVFGATYPIGTWVVNCLGSFLVGLLMIIIVDRAVNADYWRLLTVVGFMGGYTTFSSYSWETWVLYQQGAWLAAVMNVLLSNVCSLLLVVLGVLCGRWIVGMN